MSKVDHAFMAFDDKVEGIKPGSRRDAMYFRAGARWAGGETLELQSEFWRAAFLGFLSRGFSVNDSDELADGAVKRAKLRGRLP